MQLLYMFHFPISDQRVNESMSQFKQNLKTICTVEKDSIYEKNISTEVNRVCDLL